MATTTTQPSPQQRWHHFRAQYIPTLSKRQQRAIVLGVIVFVVAFVLVILPFFLPLGGPTTQSSLTLADANGRFLQVNDLSIYYQHTIGVADTIILVHGQAGSTLTWRETMPALQASGYEVYALDLPGLGLSEKGLHIDYSHSAMADVIVGFMDALNIPQAHIVAHAFSSNIGVMLSQRHPDRVQSLVLIAPTIITTPTAEIPPTLLDLPFLERWVRVLLRWVLPEAVGEQLRSATKIDEVVTDQLIADYMRVMSTADWDLTALGMIRDSHRNAIDAPLETLTIPTAVIWGTQDGWAPPDSGAWIPMALNAHHYLLEGIGHLPMHEVPSDFNAFLIEFFHNVVSISK